MSDVTSIFNSAELALASYFYLQGSATGAPVNIEALRDIAGGIWRGIFQRAFRTAAGQSDTYSREFHGVLGVLNFCVVIFESGKNAMQIIQWWLPKSSVNISQIRIAVSIDIGVQCAYWRRS